MKKVFSTLLVLVFALIVNAQEKSFSTAGDVVSFDGFDLVSYFENDKPIKGNGKIKGEYEGLNLRFASYENKEKFYLNPDKYIPQYGGWCATAMSFGTYAKPDFELYKIQDGKLYFFEVRAFFNGKTQWNKDPDKFQILADRNFNQP